MAEIVVPDIPWDAPLNWDLQATQFGETHTPFYRHIRREPPSNATSNFLLFPKLPLELQYRVLGFCDSTTLFWTMQVSSKMRKEALRLFWSDTSVWYTIDASWLLDGGFTGHTHHAIDALGHMRQIILEFDQIEPLANPPISAHAPGGLCSGAPHESISEEEIMGCFWENLQRRFPCATHVVLSESTPSLPGASLPEDLERMAEEAPQSFTVYVSFLERRERLDRRLDRRLWQHVRDNGNDTEGDWEEVDRAWKRQSLLPPLERFHGPVGRHNLYQHQSKSFKDRWRARRLLVLQATEAYFLQHKNLPLVCPQERCDVRFQHAGDWTAHAIDTEHCGIATIPSKELEILFDQHAKKLLAYHAQFSQQLAMMKKEWGNEGSSQRHSTTQEFLAQLQEDPLYAHDVPATKCTIWRDYQIAMGTDRRKLMEQQ